MSSNNICKKCYGYKGNDHKGNREIIGEETVAKGKKLLSI